MSETTGNLAQEMLNNGHNGLSARERKVLEHIVARKRISLNVNEAYSGQMSFGERLADRVAAWKDSAVTEILVHAGSPDLLRQAAEIVLPA